MSTVMSFLYQTRTIFRLTRASIHFQHSAGLHTSPRRTAWQPRNDARRGGYTPAQERERPVAEHIPFELPPDIEIPDEDGEIDRDSPPIDTITPRERRAFKHIFLEIADRGESSLPPMGNRESQDDNTEKQPGVSRFLASLAASQKSQNDRDTTINTIMQNAAESLNQAPPVGIPGLDPLSPLNTMYSAADRQQALLKFPPSLRHAARVAYGVVGGDSSTSVREEGGQRSRLATMLSDHDDTKQDPVDAVGLGANSDLISRLKAETSRRTERLRIRSLMEASQTDADLWDVMENEVFTLVKRLGLESEIELKALKGKRGRKTKGSEQISPSQAKPLNPETYGPIYPTLLFEGVHFLNTKFPRPSPYIFHVLPRVKDLGLMSYVLGVSTSFYNQLMSILWERYGDAAGVLNLMEEMRHAGLHFDQQSQKILRSIAAVYQNAKKGGQGPFLQQLMNMPEFEPILLHRLNHWEKQIYSSIAHQMQALR